MSKNNEIVSNHIIIQWNEDHSIVTLSAQSSDRASIDKYIEANLDILRNGNKSETFYKIQDLSHEDFNITPYFRGRLKDIVNFIRENQLNVYVAIVVGNSLSGHLVQTIGRLFATDFPYFKQRFFLNMSEAQAWIKGVKSGNGD